MKVASNTYVFFGTESYLIQEEINKLIKSLIQVEDREFNVITYDLSTIPIEDVIQEAEMPPFISDHKVIIAKNAFLFTGQKGNKAVDHNIKTFELYLAKPVDYSTLIFWVDYPKLDERKKIVKLIKQKATVRTFLPLSDMVLVEWIEKKAELADSNITEEAAKLLIRTVGNDLQILTQEINKMSIYVGANGLIDEDVVMLLTTRQLENNIFQLIELVANLKIDQAFQIFYDLLKNREEPIKILALLSRQFRIMLMSKEYNRLGYSERQISSQMGIHPYATKLALQQAGKFSERQLRSILTKLAEVDYEIKSGQMDKILAIEMFMLYLRGLVNNK